MPTKIIGECVHISDAKRARAWVEAMEKAQQIREWQMQDRKNREIMRRAILDSIARIGGKSTV